MRNILLLFCRETQNCSPDVIATYLGISVAEYLEIESGQCLLTEEQTLLLGKLFKVESEYIYAAALQLDICLARDEVINQQKIKIERLEERLKKPQKKSNKIKQSR